MEQQESPDQPGKLPFLSMSILHDRKSGTLSSTWKWYNRPTDTGLIMNYHALAPKRYKRSVVSGFVYRVHQSCSSWEYFHQSLEKAKRMLELNQYPPTFYDPIIRDTLEKIFRAEPKEQGSDAQSPNSKSKSEKYLQYCGRCTDDYARALHKAQAPCTVVMTLRKLKTVLPSLKEPVEKMLKSGVVYKIVCPSCEASYVGETTRHLQVRFKEHVQRAGPMKTHLFKCNTNLSHEDIDILQSTARGEAFLLTLEALHIRALKPTIITKDQVY